HLEGWGFVTDAAGVPGGSWDSDPAEAHAALGLEKACIDDIYWKESPDRKTTHVIATTGLLTIQSCFGIFLLTEPSQHLYSAA
ncbi:hypothetical protein ACTPT8_006100, partial [Pseudomonas aeruginosa]